jgi:hypothetical protein
MSFQIPHQSSGTQSLLLTGQISLEVSLAHHHHRNEVVWVDKHLPFPSHGQESRCSSLEGRSNFLTGKETCTAYGAFGSVRWSGRDRETEGEMRCTCGYSI